MTSIYAWGIPFLNSRKEEMIEKRAESHLSQLDEILEDLSYGTAGDDRRPPGSNRGPTVHPSHQGGGS